MNPRASAAPPRVNSSVASPPPATPLIVDRFFECSLLGMLASGYFAVVGSGYLDWPTAALTLLGLCLRALMVARILTFQLPGRVVAALALGYIGFFPLDYLYISASFLTSTVHMVCFLAVLKVLTAKTNRDYTYVMMIAVLELLAAALLSANLSFIAFLALFVLFAIAAFASNEVRRSSQDRPVVSRVGLRKFPRRLSLLSLCLFGGILLMTGGLFFVLPRTARAAFERFVPHRYRLQTGFSNSVTLGEIGEIKQSNTALMHVRAYPPRPIPGVHWRGAALSEFDGRRWFNPPGGGRKLYVDHGGTTLRATPLRPGRNLIYQVHLNTQIAETLFFAGIPETINIDVPYLLLGRNGSIHLPLFVGSRGLSYSVYSFIEDESAPDRVDPDPLPSRVREEMLELPPLDERIPQLAQDMTTGTATDQDKARALESHLRHDFGYTLELPSAPVADPLANFLFVRKKGHCEYFASSMAVMLRTLGIPSRVVTGFQSGVYNPVTGWQVVRASDAHSWVEAWIAGRGWTTFDPTPFDTSAHSSILARVSMLLDTADQFWQDWVLSYDLDRQIALASRMEETSRKFSFARLQGIVEALKKTGRAYVKYAGVFGVCLVLIVLGFAYGPTLAEWRRRRQRVRRLARGEGEASDATLLYERMLVLLEQRGIQKPAWLTPTEFARVLPVSEATPLIEDVTIAYNEFRFGGRRAVAPRMLRLLDQLEHLEQVGHF
jgi:transglutaminase-like putative cysteine protease